MTINQSRLFIWLVGLRRWCKREPPPWPRGAALALPRGGGTRGGDKFFFPLWENLAPPRGEGGESSKFYETTNNKNRHPRTDCL
ncbi:MAG: hypothetical protein UX09_C0042G0004 [Candidatus Uhrbacteria bacterium GW2011_GWE2_45_35]|uniref:Uncharacterized protein n=2 Tax=Candidatus Uhriibacteriota TaxID=1752732 RepID=A0A0G1LMQ3_9BACT|nr:MAG: hypothetical protein UW63_C0039G0009 [Candidatus Uhrbacteria bacterium GW2011_GWF2_44_350]KKU06768.1 MAG: hypothetical protein UX09_C0042G0004 [Candidatus Uhrbacteria bacterium GW2011_GWE2_45_35]